MINFGSYNNLPVASALEKAGFILDTVDGVTTVINSATGERDNPADVTTAQALVDSFDSLAAEIAFQIERIRATSRISRGKHVTDAPGKDAEYTKKEAEAIDFTANAIVGPFMQKRIDRTGETPAVVAAEWSARAAALTDLGATIAAIEDQARIDMENAPTWQACKGIANAAIAELMTL